MELNMFAESSEIKFNDGYGWYISTTLDPRMYLHKTGKVSFGCGDGGYFNKKSHAKYFLKGWKNALKAIPLKNYTVWNSPDAD